MTNPKEVLEKITNNIKDFWKIYEDTNSVKQLKQLQLLHFKEIVLATLTSQLEAIPEDEEVMARAELWDRLSELADGDLWNRLTPKEWNLAHQLFENQERQRQRQALQDLIKEWTELK